MMSGKGPVNGNVVGFVQFVSFLNAVVFSLCTPSDHHQPTLSHTTAIKVMGGGGAILHRLSETQAVLIMPGQKAFTSVFLLLLLSLAAQLLPAHSCSDCQYHGLNCSMRRFCPCHFTNLSL